jgi:hypothetical protein
MLMGRIREMLRLILQMEQGERCLPGFNRRILTQIIGKSVGTSYLPVGATSKSPAMEPATRSTKQRLVALGKRGAGAEQVGEEEDKVLGCWGRGAQVRNRLEKKRIRC